MSDPTPEPTGEIDDSEHAMVDPNPRPYCDHRCLKDDGHVERGEPHFYGYVLPRFVEASEYKRVCLERDWLAAALKDLNNGHHRPPWMTGATMTTSGPEPTEPPSDDLTHPDCTGLNATWCPVHGDCSCPRREDGEIDFDAFHTMRDLRQPCRLHSLGSPHAEERPRFTEEERSEVVGALNRCQEDPNCSCLRALQIGLRALDELEQS